MHQYYEDTYAAIRATGNDCILVHSPLIWEQYPENDADFMSGATNSWHEWHKYLPWDYKGYNEDQILNKALPEIASDISAWNGNWLYIGEWSLCSGESASFSDDGEQLKLSKAYLNALKNAHAGWTYWSWKVSDDDKYYNNWSLRSVIEKGYFPFV